MRVVTTRSAHRRIGVVAGIAALALTASACGSSSTPATAPATTSAAAAAGAPSSVASSSSAAVSSSTPGSSAVSSSSASMSSGGTPGDAGTATSLADFGGMEGLVAAANKEGALNVIALPPDWSNYKEVIAGFQAKYPGIKLTSQQPDISSAQEIQAAITTKGTDQAPDVFDIGAAVTLENLDHLAPYKVAAWDDIPAANKDANGLWYNDYTGVMTVGYNADVLGRDMTSLEDLKDPSLKGAVALDGDPTAANEGLLAVVFASVANGGSLDDISKGVDYFKSLKEAGTLSTAKASLQLVSAGKISAIVGWSFNQLPITAAGGANGFTWKTFTPKGVNIGSFYNQAINKDAPHPAAARLWEEYLYTAEAQNFWIKGGALPVLYGAMQTAGTIDPTSAQSLPAVEGDIAQMTADQTTKANAFIKANWAQAIS